MIFSGTSNRDLAHRTCRHLGIPLGNARVARFSDGEIDVELLQNVRGSDTYIIQSLSSPINESLIELLLLSDALKRASARSIAAVLPYFGYARQDRRIRATRTAISAKVVANMITTAGIDRVFTIDLHADQIQGFFDIPVDNIYSMKAMVKEIKSSGHDNPVIVSPDVGGIVRARAFTKQIPNSDLAIIDKRRPAKNKAQVMHIIGDVKDRDCVIVDDIVDTSGTLCAAVDFLKDKGAGYVGAFITHPVLSGRALENLQNSDLDALVVTNTIPIEEKIAKWKNLKQIDISGIVAQVIRRSTKSESLHNLYD